MAGGRATLTRVSKCACKGLVYILGYVCVQARAHTRLMLRLCWSRRASRKGRRPWRECWRWCRCRCHLESIMRHMSHASHVKRSHITRHTITTSTNHNQGRALSTTPCPPGSNPKLESHTHTCVTLIPTLLPAAGQPAYLRLVVKRRRTCGLGEEEGGG